MKFELEIPDKVLELEPELRDWVKAVEMMLNRMLFSHHKYGAMSNKFPDSADACVGAYKRLSMYGKSGNTENCLDAANYCIIEHLFPSHPKAHFRSQESHESPGTPWKEES